MRILLFLLFARLVYSYSDPELEQLWSSISDVTHPTLEDYQSIERYLKEGGRPYLDVLRNSLSSLPQNTQARCTLRLESIQNFQLLGPNNEMPVFEIHDMNIADETDRRCILIFGSYNGIYADKARNILAELKECGYSGHVLIQIGGFPNLANGGIKICHVPYAFKVAILREAQLLGYKHLLWLDTALHPLTDLEMIFNAIEKRGYFLTDTGPLRDNYPLNLAEASEALNAPLELHDEIPHIMATLIGLNMDNPQATQLLDDWYAATEMLTPNLSWYPEELSLSIIAWRSECKPYSWFGSITCKEYEFFQLNQKPNLQFFLDEIR